MIWFFVQVAVDKNDTLDAGDLIVYIDQSTSPAPNGTLGSIDEDEEKPAAEKPLANVA